MIFDWTARGLSKWAAANRSGEREPASAEGGIDIGTDERGEVVYWPTPTVERAAHAVVFAASGAGKTTLVASALAREWLNSGAENV